MPQDDFNSRKRCYSYGMSDEEVGSSKRSRAYENEVDRTHHRDSDREKERERERERERDKDREKDRDKDRARDKASEPERYEKDRERDRDKDKERDRDKDKERDRDAGRAREKEKDKERENKDKDKEKTREKKFYTPRQSDEEGHFHVVCGENLTERYKILDLMGQGTFAKVIEAWDRKEQRRIAIKIVRATKKYTKDAQFELDILERVKRKDREDNYVKVLDSFLYHDPRTDKEHLCIMFPKLGPSLLDFMNKNANFLLKGVAQMAKHLFEALDFLHGDMHLIHTDLKPENILLTESGYTHEGRRRVPRNYAVRIIDFGGATDEDHSDTSIVSTRHYRAPEVIVGSGWMYAADMWSVGCILIELYTGEVLFDTHENRGSSSRAKSSDSPHRSRGSEPARDSSSHD